MIRNTFFDLIFYECKQFSKKHVLLLANFYVNFLLFNPKSKLRENLDIPTKSCSQCIDGLAGC